MFDYSMLWKNTFNVEFNKEIQSFKFIRTGKYREQGELSFLWIDIKWMGEWRNRLYMFLKYRIFHMKEGQILPLWYLIFVKSPLFPVTSIKYWYRRIFNIMDEHKQFELEYNSKDK